MLCPTAEQLERLLTDEPRSAECADVSRHIAECAACQQRLDELTSPREPIDFPDEVTNNAELQSLLRRLREQPLAEWGSSVREGEAREGEAREGEAPAEPRHAREFAGPISNEAPLGWLGSYQIQRLLGSGATGEVFAARDSRLGRLVAIKLLRPQLALNAVARARFEREGRVIASIHDEHLAQVFEIGLPADGTPYLVMEFVDGESLEKRLRREGSFDPREVAEIVTQVAGGLEAAHRQGVVHRDVKLSNVLLAANSRQAKIVDFGLARVTESSELLTQEGFLAGTPAYMSPEQLKRPQDADARSDVYSLGVMLYELLTGERPFRGVLRMVLFQVLHEEPVPPRRLNDRIPRDLETICLKAMSKEPTQRYSAAAELAADLQRWLDGQPVLARPLGPISRAGRWCRRNPKWAVLNGVVAIVLLAGAVDWTRYVLPNDSLRQEVAALRDEAQWSRQLAERHRIEAEKLAGLLVFDVADMTASDSQSPEQQMNWLRTAIASLQRLDEIRPTASNTTTLAIAHARLGDGFRRREQWPAAEEQYREALNRLAELRDSLPPKLQTLRCETQLSLAETRLRQADLVQTRAVLSEAERLSNTLPADSESTAGRRLIQVRWLTLIGQLADGFIERKQFESAESVLVQAVAVSDRVKADDNATPADFQTFVTLQRNLALVERELGRTDASRQRLKTLAKTLRLLISDPRGQTDATFAAWANAQLAELEAASK